MAFYLCDYDQMDGGKHSCCTYLYHVFCVCIEQQKLHNFIARIYIVTCLENLKAHHRQTRTHKRLFANAYIVHLAYKNEANLLHEAYVYKKKMISLHLF